MPFPETLRVVYEKNPLEQVICQLRYPPILRIDSELPAAFQEMIRKDFPLLNEVPAEHLPVPPEILKLIASDPLLRLGKTKSYEFASSEGVWKATLTRDFLALTCTSYRRWEDFWGRLQGPLNALIEQYSPSFYTRIGLRYRNVVRRSELGLGNVAWSDLLKTHIAGEFCSPEVADRIAEARRELLIVFDNQGKVRMQHGIGRSNEDSEQCYVIDNDFFTEERTEIGNVADILDKFHRNARTLFRWCITDQLHEALGPRPVG